MRVIASYRAAIGAHRNCLQPHPLIGAQVTDHMAVIGMHGAGLIDIKIITIFHKKFAPPHHTEPGPDFIAELPLNVIQRHRQVFITAHMAAKNIRNQLFIGWPIKHVTPMAILNAQHFLPIIIKAPTFTPKVRRLQRRHEHWNMAGAHLLFVHNIFQFAQHFKPERQP